MKKLPLTDTPAEWRGLHVGSGIPKIRADAQVRKFVERLLPTRSFKEIAEACLKEFGADRAPSKSVIHRYWTECIRTDEAELARIKGRRKARTSR